MALTKLDVKGIKDGTDGQLITWDTSAVADTVATGGATQVLTSGGAGTKPAFQDVVDNAAAMALALGG
jgi:imidazole glycerol phosphate synthase subunit HisF